MRVSIVAALAVSAMCSSVAEAQALTPPAYSDPRIQTALYDPNQVMQLRVATGYQLTVMFAPDERIENVAVGDSGAWQLTPNKRGDLLFIKPLQGGVTTNLTVVTDARTYVFELAPSSGTPEAYTIKFRYPEAPKPAGSTEKIVGQFSPHGAKEIIPDAMHDDGDKTYLYWRADQSIAAVYIVDQQGHESLVNGAMRDGRYVIDSIANKFVFRLASKVASVTRMPKVPRE